MQFRFRFMEPSSSTRTESGTSFSMQRRKNTNSRLYMRKSSKDERRSLGILLVTGFYEVNHDVGLNGASIFARELNLLPGLAVCSIG